MILAPMHTKASWTIGCENAGCTNCISHLKMTLSCSGSTCILARIMLLYDLLRRDNCGAPQRQSWSRAQERMWWTQQF